MCCVCGCYKVGIVVMDVIWRRFGVSMILRKGDLYVLSGALKYLFRAAHVSWSFAQILLLPFEA